MVVQNGITTGKSEQCAATTCLKLHDPVSYMALGVSVGQCSTRRKSFPVVMVSSNELVTTL